MCCWTLNEIPKQKRLLCFCFMFQSGMEFLTLFCASFYYHYYHFFLLESKMDRDLKKRPRWQYGTWSECPCQNPQWQSKTDPPALERRPLSSAHHLWMKSLWQLQLVRMENGSPTMKEPPAHRLRPPLWTAPVCACQTLSLINQGRRRGFARY